MNLEAQAADCQAKLQENKDCKKLKQEMGPLLLAKTLQEIKMQLKEDKLKLHKLILQDRMSKLNSDIEKIKDRYLDSEILLRKKHEAAYLASDMDLYQIIKEKLQSLEVKMDESIAKSQAASSFSLAYFLNRLQKN